MLPIALALTTATALVATSSPSTSRQEIAMSSNPANTATHAPTTREAADTADREAIRAAVLASGTMRICVTTQRPLAPRASACS